MNDKTNLPARRDLPAKPPAPISEAMATAAAAGAKAAIEAQYVMALRNPRNIETARQALLKECDRPTFAAVAEYAKPVGDRKVRGPSIRFAETAARCWGNIATVTQVVYEDDERRVMGVQGVDLEANVGYRVEIVIEKTVERSQLREGQEALRTRTNTAGRMVYLVRATEDDLLNKANAQISKAIRNNITRIIPGDLVEEAMRRAAETRAKRDAQDPDAARREITDAFFALAGIDAEELEGYLGHPVARATPAEVDDLRAVYIALRDGDSTWADVKAQRKAVRGEEAAPTSRPTPKSGKDAVRQAVDAKVPSPREPGED